MSAAELFRNWLALREAEHRPGQGDDECDRLTDEMMAIERAILAADPANRRGRAGASRDACLLRRP
jgi:hypothetical protein